MSHEFCRLAPVAVTEHDHRPVAFLRQVERHVRPEPLLRPGREAPANLAVRLELRELELHLADLGPRRRPKAHVHATPGLRLAGRVPRPPTRHALDRRQRRINLRNRSLDTNPMNDVCHVWFLVLALCPEDALTGE